MDSTAGDLNHAVQAVDENVEKGSVHSAQISSDDVVNEKQEHDVHSSGSSSQDAIDIEKLDSHAVQVKDIKEGDEVFAHLPEHERKIVKRQLDIPTVKVTFTTLYRYATRNDLIIIAISALCAIIGGAVMPLMTVGTSIDIRIIILTLADMRRRSYSAN